MENDQLLTVFRRAFRREFVNCEFGVTDVEEWDSLTHIKLVMELESEFGISIGPDDIPPLYSSFQTVKDYVESRVE